MVEFLTYELLESIEHLTPSCRPISSEENYAGGTTDIQSVAGVFSCQLKCVLGCRWYVEIFLRVLLNVYSSSTQMASLNGGSWCGH